MINTTSNLPQFSRHLWLTVGMFIIFAITFVVYVRAEKQIDHANALRQQSFMLAGELRQSSDDLTRMVRTYVATGAPIYKQHYQEILDIRDGRKPRPTDHQNVYWDIAQADQLPARSAEPAIPFLDLVRSAGFTEDEIARLKEAKANSDALTRTELAAMTLIESARPPVEANRATAIQMLHDAAYHQAKDAIMRPISQVDRMVNQRTLATVQAAEADATRMRLAFILLGGVLITMLWGVRQKLFAVLGGSVNELHARILRLGNGDFSSAIPVNDQMKDSVLGWLSETQANLCLIDAKRKIAEAKKNYSRRYAVMRCLSAG